MMTAASGAGFFLPPLSAALDEETRKLVQQSSSAEDGSDENSRRDNGLNPGRPPQCRRPLLWLAAVAMVAAGTTFFSWNVASSRIVYIVNGSPSPFRVSIDDGPELEISAVSKQQITLAEGMHHWKVSHPDAAIAEGRFVVQTGFIERLLSSPMFVLDPTRTAITVWEKAEYAINSGRGLVTHRFHIGEEFYSFPDVDLEFDQFPGSVKSNGSAVVLTRVESLLLTPSQVISFVSNDLTPEQQFGFCERHLQLTPGDEDLLDMYGRFAFQANAHQRLYEFLGKGVGRRPLEIEWHRRYQAAAQRIGRNEETFAEYDQIVEQLPGNAAALYLRGRIEPNGTRAEAFFDGAIEADPTNPFPYYAKCHRLVSQARFQEAREAASKSLELQPDNSDMDNILFNIRLALGEYEALESEQRSLLTESAIDATAQFRLLAVLGVQERLSDLRQAHDEFTLTVNSELPLDPHHLILSSERFLAYCSLDYERMLALTKQVKNPAQKSNMMIEPLLSLDRIEELIESDLLKSLTQRGFVELYISLAFRLRGDLPNSEIWLNKAINDFHHGGPETQLIADALENAPDAELFDTLLAVSMASGERLLVSLAAAGRTSGETRARLLRLVADLNYFPGFPNHFVGRLIESLND